jgi:hypothetical protein
MKNEDLFGANSPTCEQLSLRLGHNAYFDMPVKMVY